MDHEIPAGEVHLNANLGMSEEESTPLPYVEEDEEPTSERTIQEHFDDIASSIAMIGLTFTAIGKPEQSEGITFVIDFLAWYATQHNLRSEVTEGLIQAANMNRQGSEHLTSVERMGGQPEDVERLFSIVESIRNN